MKNKIKGNEMGMEIWDDYIMKIITFGMTNDSLTFNLITSGLVILDKLF